MVIFNTLPGTPRHPRSRLHHLRNDKTGVVRRLFDDRKEVKSVFNQRRKSIFVDDAAVESDGQGGDITSRESSPDISSSAYVAPARLRAKNLESRSREHFVLSTKQPYHIPRKPLPISKQQALLPKFRSIPPPPLQGPLPVPKPSPFLSPSTAALSDHPARVVTRFLRTPIYKHRRSCSVTCDLCGLKLSSVYQLNNHRGKRRCKNKRNPPKQSNCSVCKKSFISEHDLQRHFLSKHSIN